MTEKKANEIFRSKYPNGEICRRNSTSAGNKYWVVFDKSIANHKVYHYSETSYAGLLNRLGFKIVYKHDVETAKYYVKQYQKELDDLNNGIKPPFFNCFGIFSDEKEAMEDEIQSTTKQLNEWKETLRYYTEDCIID